jgi:cysteine protease ATG4
VLETPLDVDEPSRVRLDMVDVDDISDDSDNSLSPTKNRHKRGRHAKKLSIVQSIPRESPPLPSRTTSTPTTPIPPSSSKTADVFDAPQPSTSARDIFASADTGEAPLMDPQTAWYIDAYTETQLRTFHSDKVRKMPLSGLDPSMLLGFLVRDEADFEDFCRRVSSVSLCHVCNERVRLIPPVASEDLFGSGGTSNVG